MPDLNFTLDREATTKFQRVFKSETSIPHVNFFIVEYANEKSANLVVARQIKEVGSQILARDTFTADTNHQAVFQAVRTARKAYATFIKLAQDNEAFSEFAGLPTPSGV
jgi:hypothetical protein